VTDLVRDWASGKVRPKGFLLRNPKGLGNHRFHSREVDEADSRPRLILVLNRKPRTFEAVADTHLVRSTYRSQGNNKELAVEGTLPVLVRFDLGDLKKTDAIDKATLHLIAVKQYGGAGEVGVFACDQGDEVKSMDPILGVAARYTRDRGIDKDPDVLVATGFESPDWHKEWSYAGGKVETVAADPETKFEPLDSKACRAYLARGS
jgi:hypothetical protein